MNPTISVVVITKNEERNIRDCLNSAKWADEVVVLDDESTDSTLEIAREFTDAIFHRKMDIEGRHRNFAYSKATSEWVLSLDADERITEGLAKEVREIVNTNPECVAFSIPVKAYLGEHWIRGAGYYPGRKVRLFRRGEFRYEEAKVHPRVFFEGKTGELNQDIIHYSYANFTELYHKLNRETYLEAEKWVLDGRKMSFPRALRKAISRFLKFYFQKGGYREGFLGFIFSFNHSLYQILSYAKYWEMKQQEAGK